MGHVFHEAGKLGGVQGELHEAAGRVCGGARLPGDRYGVQWDAEIHDQLQPERLPAVQRRRGLVTHMPVLTRGGERATGGRQGPGGQERDLVLRHLSLPDVLGEDSADGDQRGGLLELVQDGRAEPPGAEGRGGSR